MLNSLKASPDTVVMPQLYVPEKPLMKDVCTYTEEVQLRQTLRLDAVVSEFTIKEEDDNDMRADPREESQQDVV